MQALISAITAAVISAITSWLVTLWLARQDRKKRIEDKLEMILKIAVEYPYLESEAFTQSWKPGFDQSDEKLLRYDMYCTLLFNYLSNVAKHFKYDPVKIEREIAVKDWVRLHGNYWQNPTSSYENIDSYDKEFVQLINSYLK